MVEFSKIDWSAMKSLYERVAGLKIYERAKEIGLSFIFDVSTGIYNLHVYSCLYQQRQGKSVDLVKYSEGEFNADKFEEYLAEVEKVLADGVDPDAAYKRELEALNKKYGK